ncbi:hypothetical protein MPDQ_002772 [Monascus purpureus]|uniref:Xylanolytic transcriptional activator regulatory domain-containing protein n=1 Tax=Monascus purpureus TaxID=5098 RepID=A0A507R3L2_MONPU|nr:hypothetical protein MPDQ_002772 [Monascus purpureus]
MSAESEDIATRLNDDESLDPALFNFDSSWEDFLAIPESPLVCRPPSTSADNLDSLHFLDRFTSCTGFVETFDCGTQEQREQVVTKVELEVAYEQHQPELPRETSIGIDIGSTLPQQWLLDPLSLKTHQILLLVKEIVTLKPRNSVVTLEWTPATEEACLKFFSPTNLRRFLELYWAIWHPNVNFVHRPTFNPVSASSTLLAAMAMIGALVSPHLPDNENAKMWSNCVEEMVFINDDFNSNYLSGGLATHRQKIQALQAAYMVCLYQNWEGTDASKSRIRRYRFATLVSTTRDINITTARHICYSSQARFQFEWSEFAAREELIR